jgi:hypothetical protein
VHCLSLSPTLPIAHALARLHASLGDLPPIEYEQQHALREPTTLAGATARPNETRSLSKLVRLRRVICALLASLGVRGLLRMAARWIDACVGEKVGESESVAGVLDRGLPAAF